MVYRRDINRQLFSSQECRDSENYLYVSYISYTNLARRYQIEIPSREKTSRLMSDHREGRWYIGKLQDRFLTPKQ